MEDQSPRSNARRPWLGADEWPLAALLLLSVVGMAISDFSAHYGLTYWLWMVPAFAVVCIAVGLRRTGKESGPSTVLIGRQVIHWGSLLVAVYVIYLLQSTGRLNREDAGLVTLLILGLTTLLAGVHFDWRLAVLGVLLVATSAAAALVEEFFWVLLLPVVFVGAGLLIWPRIRGDHAGEGGHTT